MFLSEYFFVFEKLEVVLNDFTYDLYIVSK